MNKLRPATRVLNDILDLLYPVTCLVCGDRMQNGAHLCHYCRDHAFVRSDRGGMESEAGFILPDWIVVQESLWEFDKGGYLQDVLHQLKYGGLAALGRALGRSLGNTLLANSLLIPVAGVKLLPVPLHPARQRKRGYNQAELIAEGAAGVTGSEVLNGNVMKRVKKTRTQTGLNAQKRRKNLDGAFRLEDPGRIRDERVLLIDDVITTGATVMALAQEIRQDAKAVGIATVARA
ncbi:ComF family protein [Balneolales bacterium ANBcel1]|nr:ComF family protein [Balneolales bacterium ANBcel1]